MTMNDNPLNSLILPILIRPILLQLEKRDVVASQTLRNALTKAEQTNPGLTYELVKGIIQKGNLNVNMYESILRLQGAQQQQQQSDSSDLIEYRLNRTEDAFQELNKKSAALKRILSRIPDEITDRRTFLETIKEIASAIKKLLDAVNEVVSFIPGISGKQAVEQRKKEFVKYSKKFSTTLKEYFKEGQADAVFVSALFLVHVTNQIMITVKSKCE
ncbi:programmed cell death protein 10 [Chironomus tepperi]|uniref:programmed cell death protein 10 n=1 Tax=Chironomus tepperi TaxID=113505 RepID=UPI00391FA0E7